MIVGKIIKKVRDSLVKTATKQIGIYENDISIYEINEIIDFLMKPGTIRILRMLNKLNTYSKDEYDRLICSMKISSEMKSVVADLPMIVQAGKEKAVWDEFNNKLLGYRKAFKSGIDYRSMTEKLKENDKRGISKFDKGEISKLPERSYFPSCKEIVDCCWGVEEHESDKIMKIHEMAENLNKLTKLSENMVEKDEEIISSKTIVGDPCTKEYNERNVFEEIERRNHDIIKRIDADRLSRLISSKKLEDLLVDGESYEDNK